MTQPFLYLAPIKGITDATFRNTFSRHFKGFDAAVAPFINPQRKALFDDRLLRDVLPQENEGLPVIPQILHTDPDDFLRLADKLYSLGYTEVNWNLGCPVPMVAKKKRGSGLLPYPDKIVGILEKLEGRLAPALSIKTRLGYYTTDELSALLPEFDRFSLSELIIHARLGKQLYSGTTDPDAFSRCLEQTRHQLTYNGDITQPSHFQSLHRQFPSIKRWMIGRGALSNPFLGEEIKGDRTSISAQERVQRLEAFHNELIATYRERLSGPGHLLGRTKQLWTYLINSFPAHGKYLKKIVKCSSVGAYAVITQELFAAAEQQAEADSL